MTSSHIERKQRLAMWSPPRARSTMMMRVFEALGCRVVDEPFYAYWLNALNKTDDPGYEITVSTHETDWRAVIPLITGNDAAAERQWVYQKHMAIHMLEEVDLSWMTNFQNCFLIRNPAEVIASMTEFRSLGLVAEQDVEAAAKLVGIPQLRRIFDYAVDIGDGPPPVLEANDVLDEPLQTLSAFCRQVGLPFDTNTEISWESGRHESDGAWADDWYQKIYNTTGLGSRVKKEISVAPELQPIVDYCMPTYEYIAQFKTC